MHSNCPYNLSSHAYAIVQEGMVVHQMDVKTAFLNAPIDCELYIEQPEGYQREGPNGEKLVCKLIKKSCMV